MPRSVERFKNLSRVPNPPEAGALVSIWPLGTPEETGDRARYVGVTIVAWSSLRTAGYLGWGGGF
jgi:hypothetical protein